MAIPTDQEMLDAVKTAINARITGGAVQSYGINGRNLQYFTLTELWDLRRKLEKKISDTAGTGQTQAKFVGADD
ncbi:MAG: hypothetical protein PHC54_05430 [Candidatus Omnitrophica bacterium]|nr:hypothetical protein [Candidatus Omnitrophota bacterium]MDD5592658.1 hypothetical protein [Candidatus Omnitrophota bacterium]